MINPDLFIDQLKVETNCDKFGGNRMITSRFQPLKMICIDSGVLFTMISHRRRYLSFIYKNGRIDSASYSSSNRIVSNCSFYGSNCAVLNDIKEIVCSTI